MKIRILILLAFGLLPFFAASQTATFDRVRVRQGLTIRAEKADSIIRAITALSNHTSIPTAKAVWDAIAAIVAASKYQTLRDDGSNMTQQPAANFVSTGTVAFTLTNDAGNTETEVSAAVPAGGITSTELAASSVNSSKIRDTTIVAGDIKNATITSAKLANSGVSAGTYPSANSLIGQFTVNSQGQITGVSQISAADVSSTNEGILGVLGNGSNDAGLTSNTSTANAVVFAGGTAIGISESTSSNGGTITITNTGDTDGSNDLTLSDTVRTVSGASTHSKYPTALAVYNATTAASKVAVVADSTAFRAYYGAADVVIMTDRDRGGKFRKCPTCTADQYMVFTDANSTKWARFDFGDKVKPEYFGAVQENNNDTRGWKLALRYAENNPVSVWLPRGYQVKDSIILRKKVVIEGLNVRNETSTISFVEFDIPGNVSAIYFTPAATQSQGPMIRNMSFRDISASGNRHCIEFYAEIADTKGATYFKVENCNFEDFGRYALYVNDCYLSTLDMNLIGVQSGGGLIGVDMSGTKLATQSAGDTWTLSNINMGGTLGDVVGTDTAFVDVRDVGNVTINNLTIQGTVGTGLAKELLWADFGNVLVNGLYCELSGTGALGNLGLLGSTDNPNCAVTLNGLYLALGSPYENKHFRVQGPTIVRANDVEFGGSTPDKLFVTLGSTKRNVTIENYTMLDRTPRVDFSAYRDKLTVQGTATDLLLEYPSGGELFRLGPDSLFGNTGYGALSLFSGGGYQRVIDSDKGKCHRIASTGSRLAFTLDLALPPALRGKIVSVSMTYKFTTSDSTTASTRLAISDGLGGDYPAMAPLRLNAWTVATDVFVYPTSTTTTQIVFGDANNVYSNDNCEMWVKDITVRFGRELVPEGTATATTQKDLIFRKNISGVNVAGHNNGDLISTENGLYIKRAGSLELVGPTSFSGITGSGSADQVPYFNGSTTITGASEFKWDNTNKNIALSGTDVGLRMTNSSGVFDGIQSVDFWNTSSAGSGYSWLWYKSPNVSNENTNRFGINFQKSDGSDDFGIFHYPQSGSGRMKLQYYNSGWKDALAFDRNGKWYVPSNLIIENPGQYEYVTMQGPSQSDALSGLKISNNATSNGYAWLHMVGLKVGTDFLSDGGRNSIQFYRKASPSATPKRVWNIQTRMDNLGFVIGRVDTTANSASPQLFLSHANERVGIGTESPGTKLHVVGNFRSEGEITALGTGTNATLYLENTTGGTGLTWGVSSWDDGSLAIGSAGIGAAILVDGTTEKVTLDGNLQLDGLSSANSTGLIGYTAGNIAAAVKLGSGLSFSNDTLRATGGGGGGSDYLGTGFTSGGGSGTIPDATIAQLEDNFSFLSPDIAVGYDGYNLGNTPFIEDWKNFFGFFDNSQAHYFGMGYDAAEDDRLSMIGRFLSTDDVTSFQVKETRFNFTNFNTTGGACQIAGSSGALTMSQFDVGQITLGGGVARFSDNRGTPIGIEYDSDYSATIATNARSIPDVGTVRLLQKSETYNTITSTSSPQVLEDGDNLLNQGGTQATFTFNLPASPIDGELCLLTFNNAVTVLTISGNGNSVVGSLPTTAAIASHFEFKFYTGIGWIRTK